ncbi:MAG: hypothetical protein ACXVXW_00005 [Mycobacteriaceae bacterium]
MDVLTEAILDQAVLVNPEATQVRNAALIVASDIKWYLRKRGWRIVKLRERGAYWTNERQWSSAGIPTFSVEEEL